MIPAHNEEKVIRNILNDLICQEYKNLEILVLAHNCTDNTIRNAKSVSDERIKVLDIQTRKSGKALALNEGLKAAKGKIIAQFDTDNRIKEKNCLTGQWLISKMKKLMQFRQSFQQAICILQF